MAGWEPGRATVEYLLGLGRLEWVALDPRVSTATMMLDRGERRLRTAEAALRLNDFDGAFVAAYDSYRMAAESLLALQGLRATGGEGSHMVVEDAVSAQFGDEIGSYVKPTFERSRRARHAAQYFDPEAPEITDDDARWAIDTAVAAVAGARALSESEKVPPFPSP